MDSVEEGHIRAEMRRRREVESLNEREGEEAAEYGDESALKESTPLPTKGVATVT